MSWRLLDFQNYNIFENMAVDEAVFQETIKNKKQPTIRFYSSTPAAVTIGYFQDAKKELNIEKCRAEGVDIARRITGGRAVFHFNEITYSVTAKQEKLFPADISGTYKVISQCLVRGLSYLGINAGLAEEGRVLTKEEMSPCCFSTPSKNELLVNGRKICGSAQVRRRGGFLQHGLLLLAFSPGKTADLLFPAGTSRRAEKLRQSMTAVNDEIARPVDAREVCAKLKKGFIEELGIDLEEGALTPEEERLKNELLKKYTDANWNIERRKYFKAV
ncbi:MAG: lipoate--protein ligase family protein [Deltaproteobacteria bacterium]|nr:lipoate--protein ligase family protein [Deltaproteobacteria bacterium]